MRIHSILTSMSSASTFMPQDEACQIKSWKGNRDGSCKVFFHVPYFVDHQSAARSSVQCCPYISATSTPRRMASTRSSSSLFVPISQEVDLVASDFNGSAWRCRSRNNLITIDELPIVPCLRQRAPYHCGTWIHSGQLADVCGFLNRALIDFGK